MQHHYFALANKTFASRRVHSAEELTSGHSFQSLICQQQRAAKPSAIILRAVQEAFFYKRIIDELLGETVELRANSRAKDDSQCSL
jgi:hypothetical protein